jgi:hypothetical protein
MFLHTDGADAAVRYCTKKGGTWRQKLEALANIWMQQAIRSTRAGDVDGGARVDTEI